MTYRLTVASNGWVVLPMEIRKRLGLLEGGDLDEVLAHRRADSGE